MRKSVIFYILILFFSQFQLSSIYYESSENVQNIVISSKRIHLPKYPGAYNPSFIKRDDNYLLTFRYQPYRLSRPWVSHIGIVVLDANFQPVGAPYLLDTRLENDLVASQAEDARIFSFNEKIYVIYNDNVDFENPTYFERRDLYIAELFFEEGRFQLGRPKRVFYREKYNDTPWQKNWSPFIWNGNLFLSYTINPHEVLKPHFKNGRCDLNFITEQAIPWEFGPLRGGSPAQMVDGEYLAFFHSGIIVASATTEQTELWHYFMGAYTFSAEPPFVLTAISERPIDALGFYTYSSYYKRVIYPGAFSVDGSTIHLAYGKDDCEIWIATLDLNELKNSMQRCQK